MIVKQKVSKNIWDSKSNMYDVVLDYGELIAIPLTVNNR